MIGSDLGTSMQETPGKAVYSLQTFAYFSFYPEYNRLKISHLCSDLPILPA